MVAQQDIPDDVLSEVLWEFWKFDQDTDIQQSGGYDDQDAFLKNWVTSGVFCRPSTCEVCHVIDDPILSAVARGYYKVVKEQMDRAHFAFSPIHHAKQIQ